MTTTQTIDGVSRDYVLRLTKEAHSVLLGMVEHCLNVRACMGMDEGYKNFADEQDEHGFVKELRALLDAPACPDCKVCVGSPLLPKDCTIDNGQHEPPAQSHAEPVAWQYRVSAGPQTGWSLWHDGKGDEFKQSYQVETRPLYAEQPAPVAVTLSQVLTAYDYAEAHPHKYLRGTTNWCAAVAHKLNACLDEVTRLNAKS